MKAILKYILMAAVVIMATACEKESLLSQYEGGVTFDVKMSTSSRTGSVENGEQSFVPEKVRVRIYRSDGKLIRRYTNMADIPSPLYLVAGGYSVSVEGGDTENVAFKNPASDEERKQKLCYAGSEAFTVEANKTSAPITVNCPTINSQVIVGFDKTDSAEDNLNKLYENRYLSNVQIKVAAISVDGSVTTFDALSDEIEEAEAPNLLFTYKNDDAVGGNQNGYFIMPSGVTTLTWAFKAQHKTDGDVDMVGTVSTDVQPGMAYRINFKYARTPDGAGGITVKIDESLEIFNDIYSFKPQPEITGDGFDVTIPNAYLGEDVVLYCESIYNLQTLSLGETTFFDVNNGENPIIVGAINGLSCVKETDMKVKITLSPEFFESFPSGAVPLNFNMQDNDGVKVSETYPQTVTFMKQGLWEAETKFDLWLNTAEFAAVVTDANATNVQIQYRKRGASTWNTVTAEKQSDNLTYLAQSLSPWADGSDNGNQIYDPVPSKGFYANNTYDYQLVVDGDVISSGTRALSVTQNIDGGDFEDSGMDCFKDTSSGGAFPWGSGTNSYGKLCYYAQYTGMVNSGCAKLQADEPGVLGINQLAAGNLFTGSFKMSGTSGTVSFGIPYEWKARPTSLKLKYYTALGTINRDDKKKKGTSTVGGLTTGNPDVGSIYVAIVDWGTRHGVTSGTGAPSGMWSPDNGANSVSEGKIIGYGIVYPRGTTNGDSMIDLDIPIHYYDKTAKPKSGNYSLVIAASTSRYGDYMFGCSSSSMYVDNFHWGYDVPTNLYNEEDNQTLPQ